MQVCYIDPITDVESKWRRFSPNFHPRLPKQAYKVLYSPSFFFPETFGDICLLHVSLTEIDFPINEHAESQISPSFLTFIQNGQVPYITYLWNPSQSLSVTTPIHGQQRLRASASPKIASFCKL